MGDISLLDVHEASLRGKIRRYRAVAEDIRSRLEKHPDEWGRFQSNFNMEINGVFREIMNFEKASLSKGDESSVYKLKRLFINHLRKDFLHGEYIVWSLKKPYGYAGDFRIINDIYQNTPQTQGFDRLFDNYFLMSPASVATRNRKEDFKSVIRRHVVSSDCKPVRILDLASGPCRDLYEFFLEHAKESEDTDFHCYENDERAIAYAESLLREHPNVSFCKENVIRLALKKNIEDVIVERFDLIFSTGLFDYLDSRVATRLLSNLRKVMKPGAVIVISNYRDKYSNPALHFMEWVGDWNLVYRSEEEFEDTFVKAGFHKSDLKFQYEQQGIMQYCFATNPA